MDASASNFKIKKPLARGSSSLQSMMNQNSQTAMVADLVRRGERRAIGQGNHAMS
jgi:hypothetical protein